MKNRDTQTTVKKDVIANREMTVNRFTLNFTGDCADYEQPFYNFYLVKSLRQLRSAIFLGIIGWSTFGLLDIYLDPDRIKVLWAIRFGVLQQMDATTDRRMHCRYRLCDYRDDPGGLNSS